MRPSYRRDAVRSDLQPKAGSVVALRRPLERVEARRFLPGLVGVPPSLEAVEPTSAAENHDLAFSKPPWERHPSHHLPSRDGCESESWTASGGITKNTS